VDQSWIVIMTKRKQRAYTRSQLETILYDLSHRKVALSNRPNDFKNIAELLQTTWWHRRRCDQKEFYQFVRDIARDNAYQIYYRAAALSNVYRYARLWSRDPKDWEPTVEIPEETNWHEASNWLLKDLLQFLFGHYSVPMFMNQAWENGNKQTIEWYLHLVNGQNIRKAKNLPMSLTKKMAHHFLESPGEYSIYQALYYGQIIALGGNVALFKALMAAKLDQVTRDQEFWLELILFLINHPDFLVHHQVGPLVDFVVAQRYETSLRLNEEGELVAEAPQKNEFSLKGRTYGSLMRMIQEWHRWLNDTQQYQQVLEQYGQAVVHWNYSTMGEFHYFTKRSSLKWYTIRQITDSQALFEEGRDMSHCVSSYLNRCASGYCSIWSLATQDLFRPTTKLLTIEVLDDRRVVQARGAYNRMLSTKEMQVIKAWAAAEKLTLQLGNDHY